MWVSKMQDFYEDPSKEFGKSKVWFRKCPLGILGFLLCSKKWGILPTWFIFHFWAGKWLDVQVPVGRPLPR